MDATTALWEIEQIRQLKARYWRLLDTKHWQEWRSVFADDLHYWLDETPEPSSTEPIIRSADEFVAYVSNKLRTAITVHQGHAPEIEITGDRTATGVWPMFDYVDDPNQERARQGYGHYHETYEKGGDGKWRIKKLRLTRLRIDLLLR